MLVRKYRAKNLQAALALVKADLGDQATVLSQRSVRAGLWSTQLELTAALPPSAMSSAPRPAPAVAKAIAKKELDREEAKAAKRTAAPEKKAKKSPPPRRRPGISDARILDQAIKPVRQALLALQAEVRELARDAKNGRPEIAAQLELLLSRLQQEDPRPQRHADMLDPLTRMLHEIGIVGEPAEAIARQVAIELPSDADEARAVIGSVVSDVVERGLGTTAPVEEHGSARVVAFVGPSGVGKTTTIAKIATRAALINDRSVALVGYRLGRGGRIGAEASLQEIAHAIGVPCLLAHNATTLAEAIGELDDAELVLIDTGGVSARSSAAVGELHEALAGAGAQTHLVLNADMRALELSGAVTSFTALEPASLTFTRVDQAFALGGIYSAARQAGLPVMYINRGPRIPDDIEIATPQTLASHILGHSAN